MSAVTENNYTGNNSTTTYSFTFPYLKTSDIKASLDGVATTAFTLPTATTLQFNTAPATGALIKIFRETTVDELTATFLCWIGNQIRRSKRKLYTKLIRYTRGKPEVSSNYWRYFYW